jgi:hypothetical protein
VILCFILGHENAGTGTHVLILIFMKKFQNEANIVRGGTILRSIACVRWQGMKMPFLAAWLCAVTSSLVAAPFADLSFEAASKQASQTGKIVLVDFYTT